MTGRPRIAVHLRASHISQVSEVHKGVFDRTEIVGQVIVATWNERIVRLDYSRKLRNPQHVRRFNLAD